VGDAGARYSANLLPLEYRAKGSATPVLSYPYDRTREALERIARSGDPHPAHGYKLRYANPATGGHPFPTMAVFMQWLPKGYAGRRSRSTDGSVYCVVEGRGSAVIGESRFDFSPHDVFVVPSWEFCELRADTDCVLFSYSDRAAQEALGFWREESN
jgi:gentisate 1,2-dioxygenase